MVGCRPLLAWLPDGLATMVPPPLLPIWVTTETRVAPPVEVVEAGRASSSVTMSSPIGMGRGLRTGLGVAVVVLTALISAHNWKNLALGLGVIKLEPRSRVARRGRSSSSM
jgi:hypothetical protein